jgi:hypothetical protein
MSQERSSRSDNRSSSRSSEGSSRSEVSRWYSRSEREGNRGREKDNFKQDETPGPGEYRHVSCDEDWQVTLGDGKSRLPPCGKCEPWVTAEYESIVMPPK